MEELKILLRERGLKVEKLQHKGRCFVPARDFFPGQVIVTEEPLVCVPANSNKACCHCLGSTSLSTCSACCTIGYCSSTCQRSDWYLHRFECQALVALDIAKRKSVTSSVRLMVRLCLLKKLQSEKVIPVTATRNYNLVKDLVSHMSDISEKQLVSYAQMANLVSVILNSSENNIKEIAKNFSKLACNAHTICDSELRPVGTGLYPTVAIINHSCVPNSVLVFEGRRATVRSLQFIPKGSEVSISYIDTAASTKTRQRALKEQYFFTCTCPRCSQAGTLEDMVETAILEGYCCKNEKCDGFLLQSSDGGEFVCQKCGITRKIDEVNAISNAINSIEKNEIEGNMKSPTPSYTEMALSKYKMVEELEMRLYHPLSVNLMHTREKIFKFLLDIQDWEEALRYCRLTIPAYERAYRGCHPILGLQYYTCGKLEWLLEETENAVQSFTKASDILRITHGENTSFVKELLLKLDEARAEAHHKFHGG